MLKNRLDYKLVNFALIALIVFLLYQTGNLWMGVFNKFLKITTPFFIAFIVAYALHPFLKFLMKHKLPKALSILIIVALVVIYAGIGIIRDTMGPLLGEPPEKEIVDKIG